MITDLDAGAESWLMKFVGVLLHLEKPWWAQKMHSKLSWQAGERVHSEEAEISKSEVLRVVLMKENSNGHGLGYLEDVLQRHSMSYHVLAQKTSSCYGNVICKI